MRQKSAPLPPVPDPDANVPTEDLIDQIVPDPATWKATPNSVFSGRKPIDLIGTPLEPMLRDVLRAAKYGVFS